MSEGADLKQELAQTVLDATANLSAAIRLAEDAGLVVKVSVMPLYIVGRTEPLIAISAVVMEPLGGREAT